MLSDEGDSFPSRFAVFYCSERGTNKRAGGDVLLAYSHGVSVIRDQSIQLPSYRAVVDSIREKGQVSLKVI
jgi:hypothetical protein